jgi:hypothetical protein
MKLRLLFTLNMPSASNNLVHQVIAECPIKSLDEIAKILSERDFIVVKQLYRMKTKWIDRGDIVLNTVHVGKVAQWLDNAEDDGVFSKDRQSHIANHSGGRYDPDR